MFLPTLDETKQIAVAFGTNAREDKQLFASSCVLFALFQLQLYVLLWHFAESRTNVPSRSATHFEDGTALFNAYAQVNLFVVDRQLRIRDLRPVFARDGYEERTQVFVNNSRLKSKALLSPAKAGST